MVSIKMMRFCIFMVYMILSTLKWPIPAIFNQRPSLADCDKNSTQMQNHLPKPSTQEPTVAWY